MTILDNSEVHIFRRLTYEENLELIEVWGCEWRTKDIISWNNLTDVGSLYGIIDKYSNDIYSVYRLNNGSIRRVIDKNHKSTQPEMINKYIKEYIVNDFYS